MHCIGSTREGKEGGRGGCRWVGGHLSNHHNTHTHTGIPARLPARAAPPQPTRRHTTAHTRMHPTPLCNPPPRRRRWSQARPPYGAALDRGRGQAGRQAGRRVGLRPPGLDTLPPRELSRGQEPRLPAYHTYTLTRTHTPAPARPRPPAPGTVCAPAPPPTPGCWCSPGRSCSGVAPRTAGSTCCSSSGGSSGSWARRQRICGERRRGGAGRVGGRRCWRCSGWCWKGHWPPPPASCGWRPASACSPRQQPADPIHPPAT